MMKSQYRNLAANILDPFPKNIDFAVTNRCNLFCAFCGQNKKQWTKGDELNFDQYKKVLDQIASIGGRTVSFIGGEIFLHPDMSKILSYCRQKGISISMILTNGTLLNDERLQSLIDCKPGHIGFSIDGVEDVHDKVRGIKGSYLKTISAIKAVSKLKKERGLSRPTIGVNCVITSDTIDSMIPIIDELSGLNLVGLRYQFLTYISENKLKEHKERMKSLFHDYTYCYWDKFLSASTGLDAKKLVNTIKKLRKRAKEKGLKISFSHRLNNQDIDRWYNGSDEILHKCAYLKAFLVLPNGDFPLCDFIRYPVGNVKEKSLQELWKDDVGRDFRKVVRKKLLPGCERCCQLK